ncbi:hypothetical protein TBK1r_49050 [Stieleria magnilauensis]|uniref:Twin-arginine translocation signal domain-containing protein n=1 Tax=Stieleria magnilauensis TaxID=2527963 RepID=A0ABX5XV29_9BACT|nr:hypothetical protein TBK1r_49050 [Planctomycetes bacterium TBK1r]
MDHQVIGNQPNRRRFLKRSVLGASAIAGLPSLGHPLSADASEKASRIEALEVLLLQRNGEKRHVLKVTSTTGTAGYADFPDLDYAPALGGVAKEHLIGANPSAVEAIWSKMRRAGLLCSHRTALDYMRYGTCSAGKPVGPSTNCSAVRCATGSGSTTIASRG